MNATNAQALAATSMLSTSVLRAVSREGNSAHLAQSVVGQLVDSGIGDSATTIRSLVWKCDRWLEKNYRSDHVYRKAIVTKMSPGGRSVLLPELRANKSIIDFAIVSDLVHAFEIKSELDNSARLTAQLTDYRRIAPLVSLMASRRLVERVALDDSFKSIGLAWLDSAGDVQLVRPAEPDFANLNSETMMRTLRRDEYLNINAALGFVLPELPNTGIFSYARNIARDIAPALYHAQFAAQLRRRRPRAGSRAVGTIPAPLQPALLKLNPTADGLLRIRHWLKQEI